MTLHWAVSVATEIDASNRQGVGGIVAAMTNSQHSPDQRRQAVRHVLDAAARTLDALTQSAERLGREIAAVPSRPA